MNIKSGLPEYPLILEKAKLGLDVYKRQPFMHPVQELLSVPVTAKDMAIMLSSAIRMAE